MPKRVEAQPYYFSPGGGEIWDARVVMPNLAPAETPAEFQFASEPIPFETMAEGHQLKRGKGFVNGLRQLGYGGRDGETHSGCVEMVEVTTPTHERSAVIRSWQANHENGMPADSWMLEFDEVDVAKAFWNSGTRYFGMDRMADNLEGFLHKNPEMKDAVKGFTELGLLTPWYMQRAGEPSYRMGEFVIDRKNFEQADPSLHTGQVYRLAENPWYTTRIDRYVAKTCLGSMTIKEHDRVSGRGLTPVTVIQWDDGSMTRHKDDAVPEPLTTRGLKTPLGK